MNLTVVLGPIAIASGMQAATLKDEAVQAWDDYVQTATSKMLQRIHSDEPFLRIDEAPRQNRQTRAGEIVVAGAGPQNPKRVPLGLIHDWVGTVFIPNVQLADVFAVVHDYGRFREYYGPTVIDSRCESSGGSQDRYSMVLANRSLFLKSALVNDVETADFQVDRTRWYNVTRTSRIQEVENYGQPSERRLPVGQGAGFIWRLYSITKFEQRDGGVYIEVEAMALSRDVPASLRWMVDPIVRRVSRGSLVTTLQQTREAVVPTWSKATTTHSIGASYR